MNNNQDFKGTRIANDPLARILRRLYPMPKDIAVKLDIKNQKVAEELKRVISSVDGFHLLDSNDREACDLLILDFGKDLEKGLQLLNSIKTSGSTGEIFLTLSSLDPQVILEGKRAGVKQFLSQPIKKEEVQKALLKFREGEKESLGNEWKPKRGKIIYLIGSKGGIGTTTIAVNLASSLAQCDRSRSVVITDLTIPFGDLPVFLNIQSAPNWDNLAKNIVRIKSAHLPSFLFQHPSGFFVLPSPSGPNFSGDPRITAMVLSALRESHDFIVVDGGKSSWGIPLEILRLPDTILIVTSLSSLCIANVKTFLSIFYELEAFQDEKIKIIINRYQKNASIPLKEAEQQMNKEVFGTIPNDFKTTMEAINQGKLLSEVGSGKEICRSFEKLAFLLSEDPQPETMRKGVSEKYHRGFKDNIQLPGLRLNPAYNPIP